MRSEQAKLTSGGICTSGCAPTSRNPPQTFVPFWQSDPRICYVPRSKVLSFSLSPKLPYPREPSRNKRVGSFGRNLTSQVFAPTHKTATPLHLSTAARPFSLPFKNTTDLRFFKTISQLQQTFCELFPGNAVRKIHSVSGRDYFRPGEGGRLRGRKNCVAG